MTEPNLRMACLRMPRLDQETVPTNHIRVESVRNRRSWKHVIWSVLSGLLIPMALVSGLTTATADTTLSEDQIAAERAALMALISAAQAPVVAAQDIIALPTAGALGSSDAPLVMLEFGDYQCGFCRRHLINIMPALIENYIAPGQLMYLFIEFPSQPDRITSTSAANAALCAGEQQHYWTMRERLYKNPMALDEAGYLRHAEFLGLDQARFSECLSNTAHAESIAAHIALGQQLQVRGTPTFFLARIDNDEGQLRFERRIVGAQPLELFQREIDALLAESIPES